MNHTEYMREYRQRPYAREKARERGRAKYAANRDEILAQQRAAYARTPGIQARKRAAAKRSREANPERYLQGRREYRAKHPERVRLTALRSRLKTRYGLTFDEFERLVAEQGAACAVCHTETSLAVDHDHATGKVRGLLCRSCNSMLGQGGDSAERLRAGANYLDTHS